MGKNLRFNVEIKGKAHAIKMPSVTKVNDFVSTIATDFDLPKSDPSNELFSYGLFLRSSKSGSPLQGDLSLKDAGLKSFDYLIVKKISEQSVPISVQINETQLPSAAFSNELEALTSVNRNLILNTIAQDRTTHAVRSILLFLVIQLAAAVSSGLLWGASYGNVNEETCLEFGTLCGPDGRLQALAAGNVIGSFIYTFWVVRREFRKSEVPS